MAEFLSMGGYAAFVWPSWLAAAAIVLGVTVDSRRRLRGAQRRLSTLDNTRNVE